MSPARIHPRRSYSRAASPPVTVSRTSRVLPSSCAVRSPTRPAMDEHLRDVRAVRLVFGLGEKQLRRPANSAVILRDQQRSAARSHLLRHLTPERHGTFACKWVHEAHGGAAVDGVDQQVGEFFDVPVVDGLDSAHRPRSTHSSALSVQRYRVQRPGAAQSAATRGWSASQIVLDQPDGGTGTAPHPELLEDSPDVDLYGARRDVELRAYLLVGLASSQ